MLYNWVLVAHVGGDLFGDSRPLLSRDLDATDRRDYLRHSTLTLAAALLICLSVSIMVPSTMSLKVVLAEELRVSQRNLSTF